MDNEFEPHLPTADSAPLADGLPSTERRVANHLGLRAPSIELSQTPVAAVVQRGKQRRTRRRTAVGVLSVAAVCAGTIVSVQLLSRPAEHQRISVTDGQDPTGSGDPTSSTETGASENAAPPSSASAGIATLTPVPSNLVWNTVVPDSSEALGSGLAFGVTNTAPFLAVSSAPGRAGSDEQWIATLYRSDDGISWNKLTDVPDLPLGAFDSYNGSMYSFSTAAATAPIPKGQAGDVVIESSKDDGASWQQQVLPLDLRALVAAHGVASVPFNSRNIAAGPAGAIAVGQIGVQLDLAELGLPSDSYLVSRDAAGIQVGRSGCGGGATYATATTVRLADVPEATVSEPPATAYTVVPTISESNASVPPPDTTPATCNDTGATVPGDFRTYTWAELGLDRAVIDALSAPPHLFVESSGSDQFVETAFPAIPDGTKVGGATVYATSSGYAMSVALIAGNVTPPNMLYLSTDGVTWTSSSIPSISYISAFGQLGDGTYVLAGTDSQGVATVAISGDGSNWTTSALAGLLTPDDGVSAVLGLGSAAVGESGITISAGISVDPFIEDGPVSITKDGVTISMINQNGELVFTDASTGEEVGRFVEYNPNGAATSTNANRDNTTGDIRLLDAAGSLRLTVTQQDLQGIYDQMKTVQPGTPLILHSDDGVSWSREDLASISGIDVFQASRVQSAGNKVVVTMLDSNTLNDDGTPRTVALVGTPRN
jgi:hypothetical protein